MTPERLPSPSALRAQEQLAQLRSRGLDLHQPVRFRYLQALAARLPGQPEAVRQVLEQRLAGSIAAYVASAGESVPLPAAAAPQGHAGARTVPSAMAALAQLNRALGVHRPVGDAAAAALAQPDADAAPPRPLRSVTQFGTTLACISAERKVAVAQARGPQNAGPLNAHRLVVQALAAMQAASPQYLQRFLLQAESLLWMEQAHQQARRVRPAARTRSPQPAGRRNSR